MHKVDENKKYSKYDQSIEYFDPIESREPIAGRTGTDNPVPGYYSKKFGEEQIKTLIEDFERMRIENDIQGLMYRFHFMNQASLTSDKFDSGIKYCLATLAYSYVEQCKQVND